MNLIYVAGGIPVHSISGETECIQTNPSTAYTAGCHSDLAK